MLSTKQSLRAPGLEQEFPEASATAQVGGDFAPLLRELLRRDESPDLRVTRLADDLAQEARAHRWRRLRQPVAQLAHRHRIVPQEVGDRLGVVEIRGKLHGAIVRGCLLGLIRELAVES